MSPTSSESGNALPTTAAQRLAVSSRRLREQRALRRFDKTFWGLAAVLAAIAAVFLLLGTLQGPKLTAAQVDTARVTEQSGQQLRLFANQPLGPIAAEQVVVTPAARTTVTVQDDLIVVQFEQRLRFDTEYVIEIRDVAATSRDATASFMHRFTTVRGSILYLDRDTAGDEILRADISGTGRGSLVHAAPGIQHFAAVEEVIVVARDAAGGTSVLESVEPTSGVVEQIRLPDGVRIDQVIAPPVGTLLGLVLTSAPLEGDQAQGIPTYSKTLAIVDIGGDRIIRVLSGLDGDALAVLSAEFLPDGATLIVHALDQTLLRIDASGAGIPLPLDQLPTVWGLSTDARLVSGADSFGGLSIDLETGDEARINPSLFEGELAFGGEAILTADRRWVQKIAVPDQTGGAFRSLLVVDDGSGASRLLFATVGDRGSIGEFRVSPNDQYVAIEVTPSVADAVADGRRVNGRPTQVTTVVVDIDSGAVVRTLEGFSPEW